MSETDAMSAFYPSPMDQPSREKTLAGQPQEPWQSYSPPPADNQDTYGYPQSGQGAQDQQGAYARPGQGYQGSSYAADQSFQAQGQGQDPSLTRQDLAFPGQSYQGQGFQDQAFQEAFQDQSFQAPQDQAAQWQAAPGHSGRARAGADAKGFFGALFDFGFTSFVTPKIIKVLYVLYTVWMVVWALIFLRLGFKYGGTAGGIFTLVVVDPIFLLLTLGVYRVVLELFMVIHRLHEDVKLIRERGDRG
jgi:hypothetical protein